MRTDHCCLALFLCSGIVWIAGCGAGGPGGVFDAGPYGDQGGESTLAVDAGTLETPLRRVKSDPWIRLRRCDAAPRQAPLPGSRGPEREVLCIAYETEKAISFSDFPQCEFVVILKNDKGERHEFKHNNHGFPPRPFGRSSRITGIDLTGEWTLVESFFGNSGTQNMEVYLELVDRTRGSPPGRFKISNSVVIGNVPQITRARNWTDEELKRFSTPRPTTPPAIIPSTTPNSTPAASSTTTAQSSPPGPRGRELAKVGGNGGSPFRSERLGQPVLGFVCRTGAWANTNALSNVTPLWQDEATPFGHEKTFANPGYAVGGIEVEARQYVTALRAIFMKLNADGTLDSSDQYFSEWLGFPEAEKGKVLTSEGKRIIGVHGRKAAVMDAIGLIVDP